MSMTLSPPFHVVPPLFAGTVQLPFYFVLERRDPCEQVVEPRRHLCSSKE
jgi:hypothetical protein